MSLIAHTTDLSGADTGAFVHACALAAASGARLVTVHANAAPDHPNLPDAKVLAALWDRPIHHDRFCHACCDDVVDTIVDAVRQLGPRLLVSGTHARHGVGAVLAGSVAESVARNVAVPTLIVPNHIAGFVDQHSGALDLRRVLVPAGSDVEAATGLAAARDLLALAGVTDAELVVLHITAARIVDSIVAEARARTTSAIVMATHGHDGLLDALRGSRTEQVVHAAGCPVVSVPIV